ncbi:MAG TPA: chemotaxis protein CheW [Hyphomicrobium sp.]|nr:chemotaxis protein CheW [Hyphomicrobium sp.]
MTTFDDNDKGYRTMTQEIEVLTFDLQDETFALEAGIVREIIDMPLVTVVPTASRLVGGVINFRGKVIPLANLHIAFGMEASPQTIDSRTVVIELDIDGVASFIGLRTDKVNEVTTLDLARSEPPPSVGMRWRSEYVKCVVKQGGEFIVLPNLQNIFSTDVDTIGGPIKAVA